MNLELDWLDYTVSCNKKMDSAIGSFSCYEDNGHQSCVAVKTGELSSYRIYP